MFIHFLTGLHFSQKGHMLHYVHTFIMFKHDYFGKRIWIHMSKIKKTHLKNSSLDEVFTRLFFFFSSWDEFLSVFLTGMSSSRHEISSRRKRVNSKRHFTIDRDNFSRDEFHLWTPSEWWSYKNQLLSFISIMESQSYKTFIT